MELRDIKQLISSKKPALLEHALQIWEKELVKHHELLIEIIQSEVESVMEPALQSAAAYHPEKCANVVVTVMGHKNSVFRRLAVQSASPAMGKPVINALKEVLKKEKDVFVLASAVSAAARLSLPVELIEPFLEHKDIRLRANAVKAAAIIGRQRLRELLEPRLKDSSHRVQNEALKGLSLLIQETELEKLVIKRLDSEDATIRAATAFLIGELPLSRRTGLLIDALKDQDEKVKICVIRALIRVNDPIGLRAITELYLKLKTLDFARTIARIISPAIGERLLNGAENLFHPAEADCDIITKVLMVAENRKDCDLFLPWILSAVRKCRDTGRLIALKLILQQIEFFKHDVENLLDLPDFSTEETSMVHLIYWKAGRTQGLEEIKKMLYSDKPSEVKAAVAVLRQENSLFSRNLLKQAASSGIILAMDEATYVKNFGNKPIVLPEI
ncbi:MAG: hypothetical protein ACOYXC_20245 [Candidatus Rifleibacteriota bacterium]